MKDKVSMSDLKDRHPRAIHALYVTNFPLIIEFVTQNGGSMDEARQMFHDALFVLFEEVDADRIDAKHGLTLYIYSFVRILWNELLDSKHMDVAGVQHIHEFLELDENRVLNKLYRVKDVELKFKSLPEPGRTILRDHYARKVSLMEIAQRMGFSEELSAEKHKLKALKYLIETG